jgi:hypothetical protein
MFDGWLNTPNGIRGYRATFFSLKMNRPPITTPKTIRQITFGDDHGNITPPKSRPRSNMRVSPRMHRLPKKSMAMIPSTTFVLGLWTSRKKRSRTKAVPEIGRLTQKHPVRISQFIPNK